MIFNYDENKTHFYNKGFTLSLVLKVRFSGTRKWPIDFQVILRTFFRDFFLKVHFSSKQQEIHKSDTLRLLSKLIIMPPQHAKKVLSDSPGLVDFAIGLVNSVFNLPDGQVMFYEEFE